MRPGDEPPGVLPAAAPGPPIDQPVPGTRNVEGKRPQTARQGFGETWWKRFFVALPGQPDAAAVMRTWKAEFNELWPEEGHFFRPVRGIRAGEVAGFELDAPVGTVSSGVVITAADDTSFTFVTPQGHMFAGWIRFATEPAAGGTIAEITMEVRASDPLYQLGMWLGGNRAEDAFWRETLANVARRFGEEPRVAVHRKRRSRQLAWRQAGNIRHNAAIRTAWHDATGAARRGARSAARALWRGVSRG
ncbi:MAG: hypothetical protein IT303_10645 [Dehalococcoidia bacterium]|nr:hypothetical protein [Dehalococcoidia bacterium]